MRTGLYQIYWRLSPDKFTKDYAPKKAFMWEFIAAFVDPEDAVLWIRAETNCREIQDFDYKIMYKGKNYTYKDGD